MDELKDQECPFCQEKKLTMIEDEQDIPYFGKCYLFSVSCKACGYHQADVEAEEEREPCKLEFEITSTKDLDVRVVKSSQASVKVPSMRMSVDPGVGSNGYISNIEGVLNRFKKILEAERDTADEDTVKKKAKNLLKRLWKVECGDEPLKIIIEDPSGNSAIISDKTVITKLKVKK